MHPTIPLPPRDPLTPEQMTRRAEAFRAFVHSRRTVRTFSPEPIPRAVLEHCLAAAGSAPSGANLQPWHFVVVESPELKARIRVAAEEEERAFYEHRAPKEWLGALAPLGVDWRKPFLEDAPALIAVFERRWAPRPDGKRARHYYVTESVGLATGILITALHDAGLATLTHTPSPMAFLNEVLERPANERPFLLLVAGRPAPDTRVPDIGRKDPSEYIEWR